MASASFPYNFPAGRSGLPIKAPVAARQTAKDTNTENSQKPSPEIGRPQTNATGGDTLPIVFAKKATTCGTGGVWIQPQIIKKGTWEGKSQYLLAVSQGNLASVPTPSLTFHGGSRLASDQGDKSVTKYYKTNAELTTNKLDCPIGGDSFDCRQDVVTVVLELSVGNARSFKSHDVPIGWYYQGILSVHGSGDITNTEIQMPGTGLVVIDDDSGDDITTEWWDARPATPAGTTFKRNTAGAGFATPCLPAGYVDDPFPPDPFLSEAYTDISGYTGNRTFIYNDISINNQSDPTVAATNGTLDFVRWEYKLSKVADPSNPPTTDPITSQPTDYTAFADTTLLEIEGDLERYEPSIAGDINPHNDQISIFIEQGIKVSLFSEGTPTVSGASNKFVDLMMFFFQLLKRQDPASVTTLGQAVEISNLQALATFENNYKLWFNGVIEQQVNIIDYVSTVSEFFLMRFISRNGIYGLQPLLPLNGSNQIDVTALTPTATFTDSDILQGSFAKQFIDNNERRDVNATVAWNYTTCEELGYENSTIVRYATTAIDAPLMQFDMTDFCTLIDHAILYAKYFLAKRRHSTHSIGFQVPLLTSELIPTQIIKVVRQRVTSRGDNRTETEWYQVTEVKHSTNGISTIQAAHFPVNGSSISKISDDVVNGSFTVA
tara:strand:- start:1114 stop:3099 length:1986 start_codon:yes stop_codon:yes gene_type:complete